MYTYDIYIHICICRYIVCIYIYTYTYYALYANTLPIQTCTLHIHRLIFKNADTYGENYTVIFKTGKLSS